jgi:cell shape-determining protein MreD
MYDLLIPIIIHASIFRPLGESLFLVFIFGALLDNLSAGPAGFYLTFYIWILIAVRYLKIFIHVGSISLVTLVVLAAVALESLTLIGFVTINNLVIARTVNAFRFALTEVIWAILTVPFFLLGMNYLLKQLPALRTALSSSRQDEIKGR